MRILRLFSLWIKVLHTRVFKIRNYHHVTIGNNSLLVKCKATGGGKIIVGNNSYLKDCSFVFEKGNNVVEIDDDVRLYGVIFTLRYGGDNYIRIGKGTTTGGDVRLEASEGSRVLIGEDCMFSHHIRVYTTDSHSILNDMGQRVNHAKDVVIGNHVWIGINAMVLKGSVIPDGSIVGANSTYSSAEDAVPNSIYIGQAAKMVKSDITWVRELI